MTTETGEIVRIRVGEAKSPWVELTEAQARYFEQMDPAERAKHLADAGATLEYSSIGAIQGVSPWKPEGYDVRGPRTGSKLLRGLQKKAAKRGKEE